MTDERVERAFRDHPDFEQTAENEFEAPQKPFENAVFVTDGEDSDATTHEYRVVVRTPTLNAVVEGEKVAEAVHSGWFETLERRLEDAHTVTVTDSTTPPSIEREDDEVVVTVEFTSEDPEQAVEDALAIAEFVEGTWVQGIIPGYDYREPAASLRNQAVQNYDEGGAGRAGGADGTGREDTTGGAGTTDGTGRTSGSDRPGREDDEAR